MIPIRTGKVSYVHSKSHPGVLHRIIVTKDSISCTCPGFITYKTCEHVQAKKKQKTSIL